MVTVSRGLVAGLVGTSAMTATWLADRLFGTLHGDLPPRIVGRRAEEAAGVREHLSRPAFEASWLAQHFAYGAAAGVAYELAWRRMGLAEPVPSGPSYGIALWAIGYAGWLPLTGLYPPPAEESPRRVASLILQHLVFGTTVAMTASILRKRSSSIPNFESSRGGVGLNSATHASGVVLIVTGWGVIRAGRRDETGRVRT